MSEPETQYVYAAIYGYGFRLERFDLIKESDQCFFVKDSYGSKRKMSKLSERHNMFRSKDEAIAFLDERLQQRIENREKELAELRETASKPYRLTDGSKPLVSYEGPLVFD